MSLLAPERSSGGRIVAPRWQDAVARHPLLLLAGFAMLASVAAWLRIPPLARDTLWAEDGREFLQGAIDGGPLESLVVPYAGYLHTVPRLLASFVVSFVPVSGWAIAMTAGSCLVAGVLAAAVFVATRDVVRWVPARVAIASLIVVAPLAPREVLGNAANLHSLFLFALFWIALARPRGRGESIGLAAVALLGALTEVQSLFLLPLLLVRLRDRRRMPVRAALLLGMAAQAVVALTFPRGGSGNPSDSPLSIAFGYLINAVMPLAVPQTSIGPVAAATGPLVGILLLLPLVASLVFVLRHGRPIQRQAVIALALGSILIYTASVVANPHPFYDYATLTRAGLEQLWLVRYGVVPSMMLAAVPLVALAVAVARRRLRPRGTSMTAVRVLAGVSALLMLSVLLQFIPQDTRRWSGPAWQPQLAAAAEACETLPSSSRVALNETLGWQVSVPCGRLVPERRRPLH
ncbi:MAG: hypothetical protein M3N46_04855 [Actinomycetota bacterium]|nr:hypothetical protein [Actinomycetota bacterium]